MKHMVDDLWVDTTRVESLNVKTTLAGVRITMTMFSGKVHKFAIPLYYLDDGQEALVERLLRATPPSREQL